MVIQTLKKIKNNLEIKFFPDLYKRKFFKNIEELNWTNIKTKNIENELLLFKYLINKNGGFIDIGANLGQYVYACNKIITSERILAFEPNPELAERLKRIFKGVKILEYAVSDKPGKTKFKIPFFNEREIHTRGTLKIDHNEVDETNSRMIEVNIESLDNLNSKLNFPISLVKIDVEGAEFDVINGANEFIMKHQPVFIIEIEQRHHSENIASFLKNFCEKFNYSCLYFDTITQQLKSDIFHIDISQIQNLENHGKNRLFINNFIFVPNAGENTINLEEINRKIKSGI